MQTTLISFDLRADFGVFKKPDVNKGLQPTFNMLHKPALLGILGAIAGLPGYQKRGEFPVYYRELRDIKVGIKPLADEKGNFTKTVIKYTNTVGYANADGNLIVTEQTLRQPAYRCYLMLDLDIPIQARLHDRIHAGEAEYLPYFGKNECSAWWENAQTLAFSSEKPAQAFNVCTIFIRGNWTVKQEKDDGFDRFEMLDFTIDPEKFVYFERLPIDFDERLIQYRLGEFAYTNFPLRPTAELNQLYFLPNELRYVQLF